MLWNVAVVRRLVVLIAACHFSEVRSAMHLDTNIIGGRMITFLVDLEITLLSWEYSWNVLIKLWRPGMSLLIEFIDSISEYVLTLYI